MVTLSSLHHGTMGYGLAKALSDRAGKDIVFIQYCRCGASVLNKAANGWWPGEDPTQGKSHEGGLFSSFEKYIASARAQVKRELGEELEVKGLFWHQGESNSQSDMTEFKEAVSNTFDRFRGMFGDDLAIVAGHIRDLGDGPRAVNATLDRIASESDYTSTVPVADLQFAPDRNGKKDVHISLPGCHKLGQRMVAALFDSDSQGDEASSVVSPGAKVEKLAGGMKFTEGPVWIAAEKKLVFSDIPNSKLMQWNSKDGLSVFRKSENANGNILDLEGRLISCQHSARNIVRTEKDGTIKVLADKFEGKRFNSPNDVAVRSDGTLWFTDPPWGLWGLKQPAEVPGHWVYRLEPKTGKITAVVKDLAMPNGIVFSPDENRIYIADTGGHPRHPDLQARKLPPVIRCYEVTAVGELGKKLFEIDEGSDGMAVDVEGNVYATHKGKVHVFDADGRRLETIAVPEGPANVCFGGDDFKTLFITARTSLYSIKLKYPGAKPKGR